MRTFLKWTAIVGVLVVLVALGGASHYYYKEKMKPRYRVAEVTKGRIVAVVNSTGTVKPVRSVQVGTFVSGPIIKLFADFNDKVEKGQLLAIIDPQLYEPDVRRDEASLATRAAEVDQIDAKLQQARNDEKRSLDLRDLDRGFISKTDLDLYKFTRMSLEAQLKVAKANKRQAEEFLNMSKTKLGYTKIESPVDGVIIDRKVDEGQTVAASFQTPDLFIVAPDLTTVYVHASVDETDIGAVQEAMKKGLPVRFTVDSHPDELFEGKIKEVRMNSTTVQNVVTYPVVVIAPNPDRKLLPGMTANLSFQIGERTDKLRIPNAALRYFPQREQVRPKDRKILEGAAKNTPEDEQTSGTRSAEEKAELRKQRNRRHVWVIDGDFLRAIEVITGLSDSKYTEVVSVVTGELSEGTKLVTGIDARPRMQEAALEVDE
jgi:HlyD family secretion protein